MVKPKKTESDANGNLKIAVRPENINNVKSTDFRTIYSNNASFNHSAFDVSFIFGEIAGIEGEKITVEQRVKVTMSPRHAKLFAMILIQNLQNYEHTIGPLPLPAGLTAPIMGKGREEEKA
jgi:Protein of unknown function (DUF3467)